MGISPTSVTTAARLLAAARSSWALTGAGVSTASGIPDFRSPGGLWDLADPDEVASIAGFRRNPEAFYSFWAWRFRQMQGARPNVVHTLLAGLEERGLLHGVITQNIDGLHQRAGSRTVIEVHGHIRSATCLSCRGSFPMAEVIHQAEDHGIPLCPCGGLIKPDVVLFGEDLGEQLTWAAAAVAEANLLFVLGSSLTVWPVAELVPRAVARGATVLIANREPTPYDDRAEVLLRGDLVETARALGRALGVWDDA